MRKQNLDSFLWDLLKPTIGFTHLKYFHCHTSLLVNIDMNRFFLFILQIFSISWRKQLNRWDHSYDYMLNSTDNKNRMANNFLTYLYLNRIDYRQNFWKTLLLPRHVLTYVWWIESNTFAYISEQMTVPLFAVTYILQFTYLISQYHNENESFSPEFILFIMYFMKGFQYNDAKTLERHVQTWSSWFH